MGFPVVIVPSGGLPVTEAANGLGVPVSIAANGFGIAVTVVASWRPARGRYGSDHGAVGFVDDRCGGDRRPGRNAIRRQRQRLPPSR